MDAPEDLFSYWESIFREDLSLYNSSLVVQAEGPVAAGGVLLLVLRRRLPRVRVHDLAVRAADREADGIVAPCQEKHKRYIT